MERARLGDVVQVQFTGRLEDGSIFDSSSEENPMQVRLGSGDFLLCFERSVVGKFPGDRWTTTLEAAVGFGHRYEDLICNVGREFFPEGIEPELGLRLQVPRPDGGSRSLEVVEIEGDVITVDANHPLAGHELVFDIRLLEIV